MKKLDILSVISSFFLFFSHVNRNNLREEQFLVSLVEFLNDKKINNFTNGKEIIDFAHSNFLYLQDVRWRWFDEWRNIKLSIFENIIFTSADKGFYVTYTPNPENNIYEFKVSNNNDKINTIDYAGSTYQLNKNQTKRFVEYFDEINSRAEDKNREVEELNRRAEELRIQELNLQAAIENNARNVMKQDYNLLISKVNNVSNEIKKIVYNFISHAPRELFLSTTNYRLLEFIILRDSYLKEYVSNSNEESRRIYGIVSAQSDLYNIILKFKEDKFDKLEKIIATKQDLEDRFSKAFLWLTLNDQLVDFFGSLWGRNYGTYFQSEVIEFQDYISNYFGVIEIDKSDDSNIAIFTYFLMKRGVLLKDDTNNFPDYYILVKQKVEDMRETIELRQFEQTLLNESEPHKSLTISDIDLLSGLDFEVIIADLFKSMGFATQQTKASGDQGIDLLVEKDGRKYGVQTKCYSNKVSNAAIQETVAGLAFYNCDKGIVVTNNYFTQSAIDLARKNNVILWDKRHIE